MIEYRIVESLDEEGRVANEILDSPAVAIDIETTGLKAWHSAIRLIQIHTGKSIYIVDLFKTGTPLKILDAIAKTNAIIIGQNLKFEQSFFLHHYGIEIRKLFDTMRASNILYNGLGYRHNLYEIYKRELDLTPEAPDMSATGWAGELTESHYQYAAEDVLWMHRLRDVMKPKISKAGLNDIAAIEFNCLLPEASIELNGFRLDRDLWSAVAKENAINKERLRKDLMKILPDPSKQQYFPGIEPDFNLDSPSQMLESLRRLGVRVDSTSEMELAMVADKYPVIKTLLEFREYSHACKSFGEDYLENIDPITGRIHSSFHGYLATGRFSCRNPNTQQIPRKKHYRGCFRPISGNVLTCFDYAGIEMRVTAEIADETAMINIFKKGLDIHKCTGASLLNKRIEDITKEEKQLSKAVNFGLLFSMGPKKLVMYAKKGFDVDLSQDQAQQIWNKFFHTYHKLKKWQEDTLRKGMESKMSKTIGGRIRHMREDQHGEFLNTCVQGTAADGLKTAMRLIYDRTKKYGKDCRMVNIVHDETVMEVRNDPDLVQEVMDIQKTSMEEGMQKYIKKVPILVEGSYGPSWADAK